MSHQEKTGHAAPSLGGHCSLPSFYWLRDPTAGTQNIYLSLLLVVVLLRIFFTYLHTQF